MLSRLKQYLFYITDNRNWSHYWDAHYLKKNSDEFVDIPKKHITYSGRWLRNQLLHYISRRSFLFDENYKKISPSNTVFLNWYHGQPDSENPDNRRTYEILPEAKDRVETFIASCSSIRDTLVAKGINKESIEVIPLGVDLEIFNPLDAFQDPVRRDLGIPEDKYVIGLFQKDGEGWGEGNDPKKIKGPDVFLEAIRKINRTLDDLFVVLTGPARGYVKNGLDDLGIPYHHQFLEDYKKIVNYYRCLDLYVIPSREEGGPKALLESWATNVPVVSTRVGMAEDLIEDGVNGYLVDVEDADALAERSIKLLMNDSVADDITTAASDDVRGLGWDSIAGQYYEKVYEKHLP